MVQVRRGYVDGGFGQIHYRIAQPESESDKPPIYCLHQSPKCGEEFERFIAVAGETRTVVAPDYPGYGMSDAPPSEDKTSIALYARCMWETADRLGHAHVDLFGNHTGSKVAVEMAVQRPAAVNAITMVSAAILTDEERAMFSDMFTPIPLDTAGTRFSETWARIVDRQGPGQTLEMMSASFRMNLMGGEAYEWGHTAAFAYAKPFDEALTSLPHRITILNPTDDLTAATRRANGLMRNGEVIECPHWGYGFLDAFPHDAADLVLAKLDKSERR